MIVRNATFYHGNMILLRTPPPPPAFCKNYLCTKRTKLLYIQKWMTIILWPFHVCLRMCVQADYRLDFVPEKHVFELFFKHVYFFIWTESFVFMRIYVCTLYALVNVRVNEFTFHMSFLFWYDCCLWGNVL